MWSSERPNKRDLAELRERALIKYGRSVRG